MKLSHVLIAALVTTSLLTVAQNETPKKAKHKAKVEKKDKTKALNCVKPVDANLVDTKTPRVCPACGRG